MIKSCPLIEFNGIPTNCHIKEQGVLRGLPSAGLFSLLASFCPSEDNQQNVNGFLVYNQSRQYELLELLDAFSKTSFEETLENSRTAVNNLTLAANVFDDLLQYEINATACNESSLSDSERVKHLITFVFFHFFWEMVGNYAAVEMSSSQ
ncbi:hypothetical protein COOONC_03091 [Cooperia oncophora]